MSDDIIQKLRNAPRRPDCKHGNRPKSCLECDIEELEAENTASMFEIADLRTENERLRALLDRIAEELSQAGVDDCESGVKWLNERAAENYLKDYRHTKAAIGTVIDLARAALNEPGA